MIQEILMWISVFGAFGYTAYSFGKVILSAYQENKPGCAGSCGGCSAKTDLIKHVELKKFTPVQVVKTDH